ncbi:MAG: GNAT family N-acetyltransferase [Fibrella sp.]|nr:GNAT family N-acetyltransferase [Armatimonadota bacterium]
MDIRTLTDFDHFAAAHQSDVRRLVASSPRASAFQTWEWNAAWWRHRGGRGRRFLALQFTEGAGNVGYALLWRDPLTKELQPLGEGDADYLDIIAHPEHEQAVVHALLTWLAGDGRSFRLDVKQARPGGVLATHLSAAQTSVGDATVASITGEACPSASLPSTWDEYTRSLGKKRRANIGYYERNLQKHFKAVVFAVANTETIAEDTEAFFALHQRRWNARWLPGAFAHASARRFHYDMAQSLLAGGFLRLHTLTLDGRTEATLYCFHKGDTTYYYLGGFEPELARFSIGSVLTARAIRYAIEVDGAKAFDFLRGNESYKYAWGAVDVHNTHLIAGRRGIGVPMATLTARATLAMELGLKQGMHARFGGAGKKTKDT